MLTFTIADTDIVWHQADYTPRVGEFSRLFLSNSPRSEQQIAMTGRFATLDGITDLPKLAEEEIYDIHAQAPQRYYLYHWAYLKDAYAVAYHTLSLEGENAYLFNPAIVKQPQLNFDWVLGVTGLHKLFLQLARRYFTHPILISAARRSCLQPRRKPASPPRQTSGRNTPAQRLSI